MSDTMPNAPVSRTEIILALARALAAERNMDPMAAEGEAARLFDEAGMQGITPWELAAKRHGESVVIAAAQAGGFEYQPSGVSFTDEDETGGTEAQGARQGPRVDLEDARRRFDEYGPSAVTPDEREAAAETDPQLEAAIAAAEREQLNQRSQEVLGTVLDPETEAEIVEELRAILPFGQVRDFGDALTRLEFGDRYATQVFGSSVVGPSRSMTEVTIGMKGRGFDQVLVDNRDLDDLSENWGLNPVQQALAVYGERRLGADITASAAVVNLLQAGAYGGAEIEGERLRQQIAQLEAEMRGTSGRSGRARELMELQRELSRVEGQQVSGRAMSRMQIVRGLDRFGELLGQYGETNALLALIGVRDPGLAKKLYEGGGYDLSPEERLKAKDLLEAAGVTDANKLRGVTPDQFNAILTGDPSGATTGGTTTFTVPGPETLSETYRNLYRSWYAMDPSDSDLQAFIGAVQGGARRDAELQMQAARPNPFQPQRAADPRLVEQPDMSEGEVALGMMRNDPRYAELQGKRPGNMSEAQWTQMFSSQAQSMLGVEGATAQDAIQQGMRSGDVNATSRMSVYDRRFRDNSQLMGRFANAAAMIARFT